MRMSSIGDLDFWLEEEKDLILLEYNNTYKDYPSDETMVRLFERQVKKTPENIAVVFEEEKITYQSLDERSNKIAAYLQSVNIKQQDYICVKGHRCIQTVVNILGILKAGAAYIPIDPDMPQDRQQIVLQNSGCKLCLENSSEYEVTDFPYTQPLINSSQTAYVIYTSGSTGAPKGVVITHDAACNTLQDINEKFNVTAGDKILGLSAISFDLSVYDIFGALAVGATLYMVPDLYDMRNIEKMVKENGITIWNSVPSIMQMYLIETESTYASTAPNPLRLVMFSGDWIPLALPDRIKHAFNDVSVISLGGATEASIWSIYYPIDEVLPSWSSIPYGRPLANQQIYILDIQDELCPLGVEGNICIGGRGLSTGYLNDEEKTNASYFMHHEYGRLYRTGDRGTLHEEGYVEFRGRQDDQVKIRGFRIELGEIESVLGQIEHIKDAVAIVKEDVRKEKSIHAYFTATKVLDISTVQDKLRKSLPEYMIPPYLKQLDKMPLTSNGKLDKKNLPAIELVREEEYVAPRNEVETILSNIFKEVLGVEQISIKDGFFALGGDSIKAISVVSKMREAGYDLNVRSIMNGQTIEAISENAEVAQELIYEQGEVIGEVQLTPIIHSFKNWNLPEPHHFNQSMMVKVEGTAEEVENAVQALVAHHDMLRAVYEGQNLRILGNEKQRYEYGVYDYREEYDVKSKIEHVCETMQRSMNLETGPLFKNILFQVKEGNYLFMCLHHLVVDGVSWRILIEDLHTSIAQQKEGIEIRLPQKTASFKEWSEALTKYQKSALLNEEAEYWEKIEGEMKNGRYIGRDQNTERIFKDISFEFSQEETRKLLKESGEAYNTEINDLLLSALAMTVKKMRGQEKVTVILEGHGREELHEPIKVDRTVGWFTSMFPIVLRGYDDIEESIIQTKEMLRKVPNYGFGYGLITKQMEDSDISFNYLGQYVEDEENEIIRYTGVSISNKNVFFGIMMTGIVQGDQLRFTISYDQSRYKEEEIQQFAVVYEEKLLEKIDHCFTKEEAIKTPSDFSWSKTTDDTLDVLNDIFLGGL